MPRVHVTRHGHRPAVFLAGCAHAVLQNFTSSLGGASFSLFQGRYANISTLLLICFYTRGRFSVDRAWKFRIRDWPSIGFEVSRRTLSYFNTAMLLDDTAICVTASRFAIGAPCNNVICSRAPRWSAACDGFGCRLLYICATARLHFSVLASHFVCLGFTLALLVLSKSRSNTSGFGAQSIESETICTCFCRAALVKIMVDPVSLALIIKRNADNNSLMEGPHNTEMVPTTSRSTTASYNAR